MALQVIAGGMAATSCRIRQEESVILYLWGMNPLAYLAYFSTLMLVCYILVYGARCLLMLAGDSLILLDVMKVVYTTLYSNDRASLNSK